MEDKRFAKKRLFTPGPLSTTDTVKATMMADFGSRDAEFMKVIDDVQDGLLEIAHLKPEDYQTVIIQGSGTYGVESILGSAVPHSEHLLYVFANGLYGNRMSDIAKVLGIKHEIMEIPQDKIFTPEIVMEEIKKHPNITHVAIVHSETTSGLLNPIEDIGEAIHKHNPNIVYIVDGISSFGAYVPDFYRANVSYFAGSANKCIQGVPGFAYVFCKMSHLKTTKGNERSLVLSLYDQWEYTKKNKQFRFTPPTHSLRAFAEAIKEYNKEGTENRFKRYSKNQKIISDSLTEMGFKLFLSKDIQGCIITTFLSPKDPNYNFKAFYDFLAKRNLCIYPGKTTKADSFRIGSIGEIYEEDVLLLIESIKDAIKEMNIKLPIQY